MKVLIPPWHSPNFSTEGLGCELICVSGRGGGVPRGPDPELSGGDLLLDKTRILPRLKPRISLYCLRKGRKMNMPLFEKS